MPRERLGGTAGSPVKRLDCGKDPFDSHSQAAAQPSRLRRGQWIRPMVPQTRALLRGEGVHVRRASLIQGHHGKHAFLSQVFRGIAS